MSPVSMWTAFRAWWETPAVVGTLTLCVGLALVWLVATFVHRRLLASGSAHMALVMRKAVSYVGVALVLLQTAHNLQIDLSAVVATAGVATVAVGFAAQTSLSNLIAGLFLLFDRPFRVGDIVELEGRQGVVLEISLMSTLVRTFDNVLVRWPNEVVLKATILNYSRFGVRRVDVKVGVAYGTDLARARAVLTAALQDVPYVLLEPGLEVITVGLLDSAVGLEVRAWVARTDFLDGRTAVVETIHTALGEAGIEIPFPQVTVWHGARPAGEEGHSPTGP
ncbi:MAG: mechanosensitive ion channel family protein [Alphaproteobacteria bacterium]|nr:mechanosensitive ion channel family protein [Alphaproteobacteria bacterium]